MSVKNVAVGLWKVAVSVRVPWKPYPVKRKATVKGTKADAKLKEAELLRVALDEGQGQGESSLTAGTVASTFDKVKVDTFSDAVQLYMEKTRAEGKCSRSHRKQLEWISRELGHVPIARLAERFDVWRKVYNTTPTSRGTPKANGTINLPVTIVKSICNYLVDLEILDKNPISRVRFPKLRQKAREAYLSKEERERLFEVIQRERPYILPIVKFMLQVPCRVSELMTAKVDQLKGGIIFIPKSKNGDPLHKPIPSDMAGYFNSIPDGCEYLFYRESKGKYYPLSNLKNLWIHCRKLAGLPDLHIHDLRHVAVTDMALRGIPNHIIMKIAGWRTDMMKIYFNIESRLGAQYVLDMEKEVIKLAS
jgi:integrase